MNEKRLQWIQLIKLLVVVLCAFLYAAGGTEDMGGKWLRRFLAPAIAGGFGYWICRDWRVLVKVPLLILASVMGYGADTFAMKIMQRLKSGLAFALGASIREALQNRWVLVGLSFTVIPATMILLGVFNPVSARTEETIIGLIIYSMAIMPVEKEVGHGN
jgi:hypothetical protein